MTRKYTTLQDYLQKPPSDWWRSALFTLGHVAVILSTIFGGGLLWILLSEENH